MGRSFLLFVVVLAALGGSFVDFDHDGLPDIFLATGGDTPRTKSAAPPRNALYRSPGKRRFEALAILMGRSFLLFVVVLAALGAGGGVGFIDFDHDRLLDIFLVTGATRREQKVPHLRATLCIEIWASHGSTR